MDIESSNKTNPEESVDCITPLSSFSDQLEMGLPDHT